MDDTKSPSYHVYQQARISIPQSPFADREMRHAYDTSPEGSFFLRDQRKRRRRTEGYGLPQVC